MICIFSFANGRRVLASLVAVLGCAAGSLSAQTITVPNTVPNPALENTAPFNDPSRTQVIFAASQFSAYTVPTLITQLAFAPAALNLAGVAAFSYSFSSIRFDLSNTSQTVPGLSAIFASNVGTVDTTVFNGALSGTSAGVPAGSSNGAFDIIVNLSTPFAYVPGSNVLLDIINSSTGTHFNPYADGDPTATITRQVFVDNSTTATTGTVQSFGIVTRFSTIPEPSVWAAVCVGGVLLAGVSGRRRRSFVD